MLIEKFAGKFPLWLSPEQIRIMPISDAQHEFADMVAEKFKQANLRIFVDKSNEKFGAKMREFIVSKVNYGIVIGANEVEENKITVRSRNSGEQKTYNIDDFINLVILENINKNPSCQRCFPK